MSQNQNDDGMGPVWAMVGAIVLYFVLKTFFGDALVTAWLAMKSLWGHIILAVWPFELKGLERSMYWARAYNIKEWDNAKISLLSSQIRPFLWPLFAIPLGLWAYKVWKKNPGARLRRSFNMGSLAESESVVWPWIKPTLGQNIINQPLDKGAWAMAYNPLEFARKFSLLDGQALNRDRAGRLFASQLGDLWEGPEKLRGSTRALFACFCAQACGDPKVAVEGLKRLALSVPSGKPDYGFVDRYLKDYYDRPEIQELVRKHAYVATMLSATLLKARRYGVLPPNFFLWLRPLNRSLWLTLNSVGRSTPFSEAAGVHAHRLAEELAGYGIELAYVEKCVDALDKALKEIDHG